MAQAEALTPAQMRRAGLAATIGCALEFYDFLTYAFFAIQIGKTFFPSTSPFLSLMGSLAAFGAGFLARPVGALVLGRYGDRVGRKPAMLLSMGLMGVGILLLALTPGYATIGWLAPVIALVARLIQGFALGGEVGASTIYMIEAVPPHRRGMGASLQGIAQGLATTLGALVGLTLSLMLSPAQLSDFGWRIAMLLGAAIVPFALAIRCTLPETREIAEPVSAQAAPRPPLIRIVLSAGAIMSGATMTALLTLYFATFGQTQLGLSPTQAMLAQLAANVSIVLGAGLGGLFGDRFGRRPGILYPTLMLVAVAVPGFAWVVGSKALAVFVVVSAAFSLVHAFRAASLFAALGEGVDPAIRTTVFGLVYAVPNTIFGGATQLSLTWLIERAGTPMAAGWFLCAVNLLALVGALLLPETAPARSGSAARAPAAV